MPTRSRAECDANKVLIIEDEQSWARALAEIVESAGFTAFTTYDFYSGLEIARRYQPDLAIMEFWQLTFDSSQRQVADKIAALREISPNIKIVVSVWKEMDLPQEVARLFDRVIDKAKFNSWDLLEILRETLPTKPISSFDGSALPPISQKANRTNTVRILFLAANPSDTTRLRLDKEIRAIDEKLRQTEFRDVFEIEQHWAVRVSDLLGLLLRHKPNIVHFSGHGSTGSIILEDDSGFSRPVSTRALSGLFSVVRDNVRCVVLNSCFSEQQAKAIAEHVDCVIGMSKAVGDSSAISFAAAFYQALGFGRDVKTAFDLGCVQIDLESLNEQDTPKLIATKANPKEIVFA
jgi:CheY-like chemotaxis protein